MGEVEELADSSESIALPPLLIPHDRIDPDALKVIHRLARHGYLAYLVGGCVRDLLLDFKPKDFDIATSAWPGEVRDLFRNCRIIGRRFRLAHILFSGKFMEVSTFRGNAADADSGEGDDLLIREDNVFGSPEEDARRRDFTLNALFYDVENHEIIDYVGGLEDIERRVVRSIGDPQIRFREDPIRIMRALRFATRLGFELASEVRQAMADTKADLVKSAPPRVHEELLKTLACGASAGAIAMLQESGVLAVLMPGISEAVQQGRDLLAAYLGALDTLDEGRRTVPDSVLLATLLYPIYLGQTRDGAEDPFPWLEAAREHSPLLMSTRRKDVDRILQMFRAQKRFLRDGRNKRLSLGAFLRKDYFQDAWMLLRISEAATGRFTAEVADWEARLGLVPSGRPVQSAPRQPREQFPEGQPGVEGGQRHRGRRRGRRSGRGEPEPGGRLPADH